MKSTRISRIAVEPFFPLAWAKSMARVTHPFDDELITQLIPSAVSRCEAYGRISIVSTTWDTEVSMPKAYQASPILDRSLVDPDDVLLGVSLPRRMATSIVSVTVYSGSPDLASMVIDPALYELRNGVLRFKLDMYTAYGRYDYIMVRYTAGYATPELLLSMAPDLIEAVGHTVVSSYEKGDSTALPSGASAILNTYWMPVT